MQRQNNTVSAMQNAVCSLWLSLHVSFSLSYRYKDYGCCYFVCFHAVRCACFQHIGDSFPVMAQNTLQTSLIIFDADAAILNVVSSSWSREFEPRPFESLFQISQNASTHQLSGQGVAIYDEEHRSLTSLKSNGGAKKI